MKNKKSYKILAVLLCMAVSCIYMPVYASDSDDYIIISVDASDDNGNLKYALDSDDPSAFGDSNEFRVAAGTPHTIYVKDMAGNITSQSFDPSGGSKNTNESAGNSTGSGTAEKSTAENISGRDQQINIELELGGGSGNSNSMSDYSDYEYEYNDRSNTSGTATVTEKVTTDGSDTASKVFYTFTTKEGETLYMVIDQSRNGDNVYLLDSVSLSDLSALASGTGSVSSADKEEDNLLSALAQGNTETMEESGNDTPASKSNSNLILVLVFVIIGGGVYYYLKIYKNKKDESMDIIDARDMDEFEAEDEEYNDDEVDFGLDEENERYLNELLDEEDRNLYDADPEEYAISHMDDDEFDAGIEMDDDEGKNIEFATENNDDEDEEMNE